MIILVAVLAVALTAACVVAVRYKIENTRLAERLDNQQAQAEEMHRRTEEYFGVLANKALAANSDELRRQNASALQAAITPIKENLETFRKTIAARYESDAAQRHTLAERIRDLETLNRSVGQEAKRLADVLKGSNRQQGEWGETVLESILERAGLREGFEYETQQSSLSDEGRRLRPDVLVSFPDGRKIVIDSKVSVTAYITMAEASDEQTRRKAQKEHLASVKKHVAELADKKYQDSVKARSVDFVLMFIPHEGAYMAALEADPSLWQYAFDYNVVIVSPAHLMGVLKTVDMTWRHDRQERNIEEITTQAGLLLDKLDTFTGLLDAIDRALRSARDACDAAFTTLNSGNGSLMARARKLNELGAVGKKKFNDR